ncbi:MAG: hypothetical protein HOW97_11910 [Catenulispora sp.]|nr:hypothetical protein [Catenulispora sp.]
MNTRTMRKLAASGFAAATMVGSSALAPAATASATATATAAASSYADYNCSVYRSNAACDNVKVTHDSNDPCWADSYSVGNRTLYPEPNGWKFGLQLRYSNTCQTNFTYVWVIAGPDGTPSIDYSAKVRRSSANLPGHPNDGPYMMVHAPTVTASFYYVIPTGTMEVLSPMIWSPDNYGQECMTLPSDDNYYCDPDWR